jgi:hypothetical protein
MSSRSSSRPSVAFFSAAAGVIGARALDRGCVRLHYAFDHAG